MARAPASEATRKRIKEMMANGAAEQSTVIREAARLIIEQTLEAEISEAIGRSYYAHREGGRGQRNGYRRAHVDSAEGRIEYGVPQVRGIAGWQSEVRRCLGGKSEELERLAIQMYARGLSMRDIEAAFTTPDGRSILTRAAASRVAEQLWEDYQAFATRSLAELAIAYLFVDGVA